MAQVEVNDYVLWTKKIHGDDHLKRQLEALEPGETIALTVNGVGGIWRKMRANKVGRYNVPGLAPLGQAKAAWGELYRKHKPTGGVVVELRLARPSSALDEIGSDRPQAVWASGSGADRDAAWEAVKSSWSAGWRSEAPYGPREELYDRDDG